MATDMDSEAGDAPPFRKIGRRVGILTLPVTKTGVIPLGNLARIVASLAEQVYVVTGGDGYSSLEPSVAFRVFKIDHNEPKSTAARIWLNFLQQLKLSGAVIRIGRKVDAWIFFIGSEAAPVPILFARLIGIDTILLLAGSPSEVSRLHDDKLSRFITLLSNLTLALSRKVVAYSDLVIKERGLSKYQDKIAIASEHVVDLEKFRPTKPFSERGTTVGYVGGISKQKGVTSFAQAIPKVLEANQNTRFVICGEGETLAEMKAFVFDNGLSEKVSFTGWIPHDDVPEVLNQLTLLVLPSHTEGLPNVVLEAMACGTPVLTTQVGAIPSVVKDGETGFFMANRAPETIARSIVAALKRSDLDSIGERARNTIEKNFEFSKVAERFSAAIWPKS